MMMSLCCTSKANIVIAEAVRSNDRYCSDGTWHSSFCRKEERILQAHATSRFELREKRLTVVAAKLETAISIGDVDVEVVSRQRHSNIYRNAEPGADSMAPAPKQTNLNHLSLS
eukprot:3598136-Amphidinium_carterae.1